MKSGDSLQARFGGNMRESVGAGAPAFPGLPAASGADAERLRGVSTLKRAFQIPVDRLTPDPDQPRREFDDGALRDLAESLKARGQLQPVRVRWDGQGGRWVIVSGERRWRAAVLAGLTTLQCVEAKADMTPGEILEDQLVENCLRENLKPIDQARAFKALMDAQGLTHRQIGERLHIAPSAVSQSLALLGLPGDVQGRVEAGELAPSVAYEISKVDSPSEQAALADRVVSEGMSRADTVAAVRRSLGRSTKTKGRGRANARKLTSKTFKTPVARVTVELRKGDGLSAMASALEEAARQARGLAADLAGGKEADRAA